MWGLVGRLADESRFLICEQVRDEDKDQEMRRFVKKHPSMVVDFADMHECFLRFQIETKRFGMELVDPRDTTGMNEADPFVVALALMLEQRDLDDLRRRTNLQARCVVVTHERRRKSTAQPAKIPDVCDFYELSCVEWLGFLKNERYAG
jgi:hypothetical protein